jgi:phosphoserine phosphatase
LQYVVTLIAPRKSEWFNAKIIYDIKNIIPNFSGFKWLAKNEALDIFFNFSKALLDLRLREDDGERGNDFSQQNIAEIKNAIAEYLADKQIDFALQPVVGRQKQLLIADMDSTIVTTETLDELAGFIGLKDQVAQITARAMRGEIHYHTALRERVALLQEFPQTALEKTYQKIHLTNGAKTLIQTMRNNGAFTYLVSSGFAFFTNKICDLCGFHDHLANKLEIKDGKLTGKVIEPILDKYAKHNALKNYAQQNNIPLELTMAVGDGANDMLMIKEAGVGVAFHAKPILAEKADIIIKHTDLTALLYIQGYSTFFPEQKRPG